MYYSLPFPDFIQANLRNAKLKLANLRRAELRYVDLVEADLQKADLREAYLRGSELRLANLSQANLRGAYLVETNLMGADLTDADLFGANLTAAVLRSTKLIRANLSDAIIYGVSVWDTETRDSIQKALVITPPKTSKITIDNIEVAQFVYLLLHNENIRSVIDTITSKVVLILGRFTLQRKKILDAIREELRNHNYLPVLFDFEQPASRDLTETISTLAHISHFIIADITDAKSIPQELGRIIPSLPSVPIQPLLLAGHNEYNMFEHFKRFPWVLKIHVYENCSDLVRALSKRVIEPAELMTKVVKKKEPPNESLERTR